MFNKIVKPLGASALLLPGLADAHIKWFAECDVSEPPSHLTLVSDPMFWGLLVLASVALFIVFFVDVSWSRGGRFNLIERRFSSNPNIATDMMRIGTGLFFTALWLIGDVILTPESVTDDPWVGTIQLLTALFTLSVPTLVLSGLGILALYGIGISEYGIYHMIDYVIFIGVALYLILTGLGIEWAKRIRLPMLMLFFVFSFLWSAIEKFGYPQWFDPFLDEHAVLTMGLPRHFFLLSAAFVEFTLVYVLLTGRNVVVLGALALNALIIAGTIYFGKIDALGHFLMMVILAIMAIKGGQTCAIMPDREGRSVAAQSGILVMGYWATLALFFALYYAVHAAIYGIA